MKEEKPMKQVAAAETQTQTQTQTKVMTQAEREQLEIQELKKEQMYCWYCIYADDIQCEERISYLNERYGTNYLEGLKSVLEKGKECKAKGLV